MKSANYLCPHYLFFKAVTLGSVFWFEIVITTNIQLSKWWKVVRNLRRRVMMTWLVNSMKSSANQKIPWWEPASWSHPSSLISQKLQHFCLKVSTDTISHQLEDMTFNIDGEGTVEINENSNFFIEPPPTTKMFRFTTAPQELEYFYRFPRNQSTSVWR